MTAQLVIFNPTRLFLPTPLHGMAVQLNIFNSMTIPAPPPYPLPPPPKSHSKGWLYSWIYSTL